MYKQFKKELENKKMQLDLKDIETCDKLKRCWDIIDKQCNNYRKDNNKKIVTPVKAGGWRTVRIFVSSTFTDFYNEREILVKQVFPELREWCEARRIQLIDCDLRWGIPKDTTTGETIAVCLEELDACYETNEGEPFFLNMTCDRYGWIPSEEDIPDDVKEKYDWVPDTSITFMEILHGALRKGNSNAVFFIRNNDFISQIPKDHLTRFKDIDTYSQQQLKLLKAKMSEIFPTQVYCYDVKYKGVSEVEGKELVIIEELEQFAGQVLDFFKSAIEQKYPVPELHNDIPIEELEKDHQWAFITERAESMIGRENEVELLLNFCKGEPCNIKQTEISQPSSRKSENWNLDESDNKLCVVEAKSGWGKTSLLAKVTAILVQEGFDVFYHFCGGTNLSRQSSNLIQRLLHYLDIPPKAKAEENEEETKPLNLLKDAFEEIRKSKRKIIIVFDAVNELTSMALNNHLSWLPPTTPCNVRCIVSCNQHAPSLARLAEHPCYWFQLADLGENNLKALAVSYLGTFNKRLDEEQLDLLVNGTGVDNPLWIRLMCEELRVFGDFRNLTSKIRDLPKSLDELFSTIFTRLLAEDSTGCIKKTLCLIAISYCGLPLADIMKILGDVVKNEIILIPRLHWAQARRHLKPYIRTIGYPNDILTFSHEYLWKAVEKILLTNRTEVVKMHVSLADYFQNICENPELRSQCVPYHLQYGNLGQRLVDFLRTDVDAARLPDFVRSNYLQAFRCPNMAKLNLPNNKEVKFCAFCSSKRSKMKSGSFWTAKDSCIICGAHIWSRTDVPGRTCGFHGMGLPNTTKCFSCNNVIWEKHQTSMMAVKGFLCNNCGFGVKGSLCSLLVPRN
ncbi:telomerase protein component 1 isoform X1 [Patella vulgata]|uniref:telomerase protein component 1 isoform X1 n=1 Tax=Patella vulgata TaxID=6465 RepID=UPI0024A91DB3|nr:telomerase protein component 1 isoform X1 [Patella vulgata]